MGAIAIVVAGGPLIWPPPDSALLGHLRGAPDAPRFDEVIAVDGGLDVALAAGLIPTLLLGDLDSVSPSALGWAKQHGIPVVEHPADKDDTDTALALAHVAATGRLAETDVVLLGGVDVGPRSTTCSARSPPWARLRSPTPRSVRAVLGSTSCARAPPRPPCRAPPRRRSHAVAPRAARRVRRRRDQRRQVAARRPRPHGGRARSASATRPCSTRRPSPTVAPACSPS